MESKTVNLGIIGYGRRAQGLYSYLYNLNKNVIFYGVLDNDERSIKMAKNTNPNVKVYSTLTEICEDKAISWVLIASWNNFHKD